MAPANVTVYFDYYSPYSYFVSLDLEPVCARYGVVVEWKPVDVVAMLGLEQADIYSPAKRRYVNMDVFRSAAFHGAPINIPKPWPMRSRLALRVSIVAAKQAWYRAFRRRVFQAAWEEQQDIGDAAVLAACVRDAGGEAAPVLAAATTAQTEERLRELTRAAMADGVFGVPLMVFEGEPFFGRDRLDMLEWRLRGRDEGGSAS